MKFLHPVYKDIRFADYVEYINKMNNFFRQNLTENGFAQLEDFKIRTGMFGILDRRNYRSSEIFWKAAKNFYPELSNLALKLLNICASTGELERLFSQWAYVHDPKRNRLKPERSAKLVCLYYSLRMRDNIRNIHFHENMDQ